MIRARVATLSLSSNPKPDPSPKPTPELTTPESEYEPKLRRIAVSSALW